MQRITRRVATAERVVTKRFRKERGKAQRRIRKESTNEMRAKTIETKAELKNIKQDIRNDWNMGPLSPRKDVGSWEGAYGSVGESRYGTVSLPYSVREERCKWAGGVGFLNIAVGDRVVLLDGPDKGSIGTISEMHRDTASVTVNELNKTNVRLPEFYRVTKEVPPAECLTLPISISAVRLIHPITDPVTGTTRDVIINRLVCSDYVKDRLTGKRRWDRVVPGLNVSIPWPVKPEREISESKADTLRIDVEAKTFVPTLLRPPMPEAVIDELRNKYSRFRTRHEPEYIARIEAEEQAKKDRAELMKSMRTPLQELNKAERTEKKKKGKPRLSIEMLEKIGEVIARNRERILNNSDNAANAAAAGAAAVPDVPPPPPSTTSPVIEQPTVD